MNTIREWFHLVKGRNSFDVDPECDGELLFGNIEVWEQIKSKIDQIVVSNKVPKMVMDGEYGVGKTHILFHIKHYLEKEALAKFRVFYIRYARFANVDDRSYYGDFHFDVMNTISKDEIYKIIQRYKKKVTPKRFDNGLKALVANDDIARAFMAMANGEKSFLSWKWLWGMKLSASEQAKLEIPYSLSKPTQFVEILVSISKLLEATEKRKALILMDEAEKLQTISNRNAINSFNTAFRTLADDTENPHVGFIVAKRAVERVGAERFWEREDFRRRITPDNYITLKKLTEAETMKFVLDLLTTFVDKESVPQQHLTKCGQTYPFQPEALGLLVQKVYQKGAGAGSLPSLIIQKVNAIAAKAVLADQEVISRDFVEANY